MKIIKSNKIYIEALKRRNKSIVAALKRQDDRNKKLSDRVNKLFKLNAIKEKQINEINDKYNELKNDNNKIWKKHFHRVYSFANWALEVINGENYDVCYAHDSLSLAAADLIVSENNCKFIYDAVEYPEYSGRSGEMATKFADEKGSATLIGMHEKNIIKKVDVIIIGSPGVKKWYENNINSGTPIVVRNCLDFQKFTVNTKIRKDCELRSEDKLILYPNSIHNNCGINELLFAMDTMDENIHLAIMGNIAPSVEMAGEVSIKEISRLKRVHIISTKGPKEMLQYRSGADLAIIPFNPKVSNHYSGLPNRVFESIMCGLPLVIADLPYIKKLVEEHQCGSYFESYEPDKIKQAIMEVLDNLDFYKEKTRSAARKLCWENEEKEFIKAVMPIFANDKQKDVICLANKSIETNRRMFRHTRSLADLGHSVTVLAKQIPCAALRDKRIVYKEMVS